MASHVSLQVARLEEKFPFLQSQIPFACEECFSGMFAGWRCLWSDHVPKILQPWLSKYEQLLHEDSLHGETSLPIASQLATFMVDLSACFLKEFLVQGGGILKISFGNVPRPWASPILKHEAKFIVNQTYIDREANEWLIRTPQQWEGFTPISRHNLPLTLEEQA